MLTARNVGIVAATATGGLAVVYVTQHASQFSAYVQEVAVAAGPLGPVIFILAYILATVLFVPGSLLTLAAGYLYGPAAGTAIVSAASTLGATAAFCVARYAARPWVESKLEAYPRFRAVDRAVSQEGARIVLLLRLSPLFPFTLLNYALGLTRVGLVEYVGASWLGMLPGTFAYVFLGGAGKVALDATSGAEGGGFDWVKIALYGVGAAATLWATRLISTAAGAALEEAEKGQQDK